MPACLAKPLVSLTLLDRARGIGTMCPSWQFWEYRALLCHFLEPLKPQNHLPVGVEWGGGRQWNSLSSLAM